MKNQQAWVEGLRELYPVGTRIRLNSMSDPFAPVPPGTEGEVRLIDGMGTMHMKWDNGRTLGVVPGEDSFTVLSRPEPEEKIEIGGMKFE